LDKGEIRSELIDPCVIGGLQSHQQVWVFAQGKFP
jgi:hypothetical protein